MKNLVVGYFGLETNKLDGQTVKTRNIYRLLEERDSSVKYFDTEKIKINRLSIVSLFFLILKANRIYYIPAHNSLKKFFPILFRISKLFKKKLYYFMVGGWLTDFLKKNEDIRRDLGKIDRVFCETHTIERELLINFAYQNLDYFPNFRDVVFQPTFNPIDTNKVKMVYLGRLNEGKGILDLFKIERYLMEAGISNFSIDLYGQIQKEFEPDLKIVLEKSTYIRYKGVLQPEDIYSKLHEYDLMLFPTHHYTEGLPGTVLDAYLAGIPVLASDWKHAREFIDDGSSGFIYRFEDIKDFNAKLIKVLSTPGILQAMKRNAYKKSESYTKNTARLILNKLL